MIVVVYGGLIVDVCVIVYLDEIFKIKFRQGIYYYFKLEVMKKVMLVDFLFVKFYGIGVLLQRIEVGVSVGWQMICDFWLWVLCEVFLDIIFGLWFILWMDFRIVLVVFLGYVVLLVIINFMLCCFYVLK